MMKTMNKVLMTSFALFISWGAIAHQPDLSTTILVDQGDYKWVLQIRAALTAFEYGIEQHYGEAAYATPEEFQNLVLHYLQNNVSLRFNDTDGSVLQNGRVKLGHETTVTFDVLGAPESIQSLQLKNQSFSDISRNKSALIVLRKGFSKDQFILNNSNDHTVDLIVKGAKFKLATPLQKKISYFLLILGGAFLSLAVLYFAFYNKKNATVNLSPLSA